jgi:membrane-bound serine protease (ClpP class)
MRKWICLTLLMLFSTAIFAANKAILLEIKGPIGPAAQDYITRGISDAVKAKASAVILQLDTPGGLESSMRGINEAIIASPIPVITYVAPSGARAASAGAFIMYASHIAAMAPGTNIGAATPVNLTGSDQTDAKSLNAHEQKALNDAAAYFRSLAQLRGRNQQFADDAVRKSISFSAEEAKKQKVIDEIAIDYPDLFQKIDGRITQVQGKPYTINTKSISIEKMPTDWRYDFLSFITNPNIAYLLMLAAMYGLFFELTNPGLILPGVADMIALLLVLYAFQLMPINYVGLSLIVLGIAFMLIELYVSSFGVLAVGGIIAFIIGSVMLFDVHNEDYQIAWSLIGTMSLLSVGFFFLIMNLAVRSHKKVIVTGKEGLIGQHGIVLNVMNEQVVVRVAGEIWEARSHEMLERQDEVKVTAVNGLVLTVTRVKKHR